MPRRAIACISISCVLLTALLAGCRTEEGISQYTVPKKLDRMLAAMIPVGEDAWFFKITGPDKQVAEIADRFRDFLTSVRFADDESGKPTWTLPTGWIQRPGEAMRYATIRIESELAPLEMSVITFPIKGDDLQQYRLENVNRWRDELRLARVESDQLDSETEQIVVAGHSITMVNLVGQLGGGPMPPFAAGGRGASGSPETKLTYDTPENWQPGQLTISRMGVTVRRKAAFDVVQDGRAVEITITNLPGTGPAARRSNIERWQVQLDIDPAEQPFDDGQLAPLDVDGVPGLYLELVGPDNAQGQQAIFGVLVERGPETWFFKMQGDLQLAEQERERFQAFVKSVSFN